MHCFAVMATTFCHTSNIVPPRWLDCTPSQRMRACPPGLGSAALVLSIAAPFGGNLWYLITLISPAAGAYYLRKGDRQEEVSRSFTCASLCTAHCAMCVPESRPAAWQGMAAPLWAMLREEHVLLQYKVKMVTADDEQTTDIITEGDVEETTRFCRVRRVHLCHRTCPPLSSCIGALMSDVHVCLSCRSWSFKKRARSM